MTASISPGGPAPRLSGPSAWCLPSILQEGLEAFLDWVRASSRSLGCDSLHYRTEHIPVPTLSAYPLGQPLQGRMGPDSLL